VSDTEILATEFFFFLPN